MLIFKERYLELKNLIETYLEVTCSPENLSPDFAVSDSVRYSLLAGGKRIRPILALAVAISLNCEPDQDLIGLAASLEMIHSYSLIHDDLPALDNDQVRRGKPTNHMVYGEDIAIIAGDALLNLAYENILDICQRRPELIGLALAISKAAGVSGMVGGQSLDLSQTKGDLGNVDVDALIRLQELKTGALIKAAVSLGYGYAEVNNPGEFSGFDKKLDRDFQEFASKLGLEFQIRDDILDETADPDILGKSVGKDQRDEKLTFVSLLGLNEAEAYDHKLRDEIIAIVDRLEAQGLEVEFLRALCNFLLEREY